jgi:hypothetical protein
MAKKISAESGRAVVRDIGRVTVTRLTLYYIFAGALLLLLTAIFPEQPTAAAQAAPGGPEEMLDWFQSQVALFPEGAPRWADALVQMLGALLLVLPLAFVYVRTRTRLKYDHSLVQTVIMLPIVVTAILVVVRNSLALAFSLAGIVAAVRFRNNLKESGDAVYIFGSIGIGFATGIHALSVAAVLSIFFVVVELALWKFNFNAEFEETFARLCMPSGADLEAISQATGEFHRPMPSAAGGGTDPADGKTVALRVYVDAVEPVKATIEMILERDAKRWSFVQSSDSDGGPKVLEYRVRPRKSIGLDALRDRLLREGAPHVVAADGEADGRL